VVITEPWRQNTIARSSGDSPGDPAENLADGYLQGAHGHDDGYGNDDDDADSGSELDGHSGG